LSIAKNACLTISLSLLRGIWCDDCADSTTGAAWTPDDYRGKAGALPVILSGRTAAGMNKGFDHALLWAAIFELVEQGLQVGEHHRDDKQACRLVAVMSPSI